MRIAWFSPLPPVRSGVADYSLELVRALAATRQIDGFVDQQSSASIAGTFSAHDFVWKQARTPYDLVVYQLGNAPCHDYMWPYMARYPGLVVLHDARLHHARARQLLRQRRSADYRAEFHYDHPDAAPGVAEYTVEGLGGTISYLWRMLGAVARTARLIAVHNQLVAQELRDEYPGVTIETIRMGVPAPRPVDTDRPNALRAELRIDSEAMVFTAFGKITAEKRIAAVLRAISGLTAEHTNAVLLLVGDTDAYPSLTPDVAALGIADRVRMVGYVPDLAIDDYLALSDVALCLRWPTTGEMSASWLRCLAASRPTIVSDLAQLADVPALDPRTWRPSLPGRAPIAVSIDLVDEDRSLLLAMRRLASDRLLARELGKAGHEYWSAHHTVDLMLADYDRLITAAASRPVPHPIDLPHHLTDDYTEPARAIARQFGVDVDVLRADERGDN